IASRARPRRCVTSFPSTKICPASGFRIPSTHLIITDLPVPEPPMTTTDSPRPSVRSSPSSTTLSPKRFFTPRSSTLGSTFASAMGEDHGGEDIVGREHQDRGAEPRVGGGGTHALRAALGVEAVVAAHQRDDEAE